MIAPGTFGGLVAWRVDPLADIAALADPAVDSHGVQAGRIAAER